MYRLTKFGTIQRDDGVFIPVEPESPFYREYLKWVAAGNQAEPYVVTPEQHALELMDAVVLAVQARLDAFARDRGYDNIVSLCSYSTSSHARFKADADCGVAARDGCWGAALQIKEDVRAGFRPMPTLCEVLSELPALKWPEELQQ